MSLRKYRKRTTLEELGEKLLQKITDQSTPITVMALALAGTDIQLPTPYDLATRTNPPEAIIVKTDKTLYVEIVSILGKPHTYIKTSRCVQTPDCAPTTINTYLKSLPEQSKKYHAAILTKAQNI